MPPIKDQAQLDDMRKRLYERGAPSAPSPRTGLSDIAPTVQRSWPTVPSLPVQRPEDPREETLTDDTLTVHAMKEPGKRRYRYRTIVLLATLAVFILVLGATSLFMFLGTNQISSQNIAVTMTGPLTVGGGEVMPLQVSVTNQNSVAVESAVLIVNFPSGTKTDEESPKDLLEQRIPLEQLGAGEALNIPIRAVVFGEENQEREIRARVEYRMVGSSGTFYKDTDPFMFKITSSPVVIRVDALEKVSSGQEVSVKLTVQSNASAPIRNILVSANFPSNFDFSSATPDPVYRENEWMIDELLPEQSKTITIKGVVTGQQDEEFQMQFSAGTPQNDNQFIIGSVLANATTDFVIEQPFINVNIGVNGNEAKVVTLKTGDDTTVMIEVRNTLTDTLYDMSLEVGVKGNILVRESVQVNNGYYDSVKDVIRFEVSGDPELAQVSPGETKSFSFTLRPSERTETPSYTLTANAFARRVFENRATEQLVGTASTEVKYTSSVEVTRKASRLAEGFTQTGPIPPVADISTSYTIFLDASAGGNDVTGATLTTSLPQYVNWQNQTIGDGTMVFNPISKEVTWTIGDIKAGTKKQIAFQVSLLPSQNQIDTTPALLGAQRFRATDRFTNEVVRAEGLPLSTELEPEFGYPRGNGKVVRTAGSAATDN